MTHYSIQNQQSNLYTWKDHEMDIVYQPLLHHWHSYTHWVYIWDMNMNHVDLMIVIRPFRLIQLLHHVQQMIMGLDQQNSECLEYHYHCLDCQMIRFLYHEWLLELVLNDH